MKIVESRFEVCYNSGIRGDDRIDTGCEVLITMSLIRSKKFLRKMKYDAANVVFIYRGPHERRLTF